MQVGIIRNFDNLRFFHTYDVDVIKLVEHNEESILSLYSNVRVAC